MLSVLIAASLAASPSEPNTFVFGIGSEDCTSAHDPDRTLELQIWIMGYWSGLNVAARKQAGKNDPVPLIFEAVRLHCSRHPRMTLMQATYDIWQFMQAETDAM